LASQIDASALALVFYCALHIGVPVAEVERIHALLLVRSSLLIGWHRLIPYASKAELERAEPLVANGLFSCAPCV
jgi:hypothetical protein